MEGRNEAVVCVFAALHSGGFFFSLNCCCPEALFLRRVMHVAFCCFSLCVCVYHGSLASSVCCVSERRFRFFLFLFDNWDSSLRFTRGCCVRRCVRGDRDRRRKGTRVCVCVCPCRLAHVPVSVCVCQGSSASTRGPRNSPLFSTQMCFFFKHFLAAGPRTTRTVSSCFILLHPVDFAPSSRTTITVQLSLLVLLFCF